MEHHLLVFPKTGPVLSPAEESHIPACFREAGFSDFQLTDSNRVNFGIAETVSRLHEQNHGLYLYGPAGTGKTMLACIMGNRLLGYGKSVRFANSKDMKQIFRHNEACEEKDRNQELEKAYFLILDNLGSESFNTGELAQFLEFIDARFKENRMTIFTSLYNPVELKEILTDRTEGLQNPADAQILYEIISRICLMAYMVEFEGEAYRMLHTNENKRS